MSPLKSTPIWDGYKGGTPLRSGDRVMGTREAETHKPTPIWDGTGMTSIKRFGILVEAQRGGLTREAR